MLCYESLKEADAKKFTEVAELFRSMATEAELACSVLEPYEDMYFPLIDGPVFPIKEDLTDSEYGIGCELQEWLRDSAKLLDYIAASIRTIPMIYEAMGINISE